MKWKRRLSVLNAYFYSEKEIIQRQKFGNLLNHFEYIGEIRL